MTDEDWNSGSVRSLMLRLAGDAMMETDKRGRAIVDDTLLILLNALDTPLPSHCRRTNGEFGGTSSWTQMRRECPRST